jgi:hypothetical protein
MGHLARSEQRERIARVTPDELRDTVDKAVRSVDEGCAGLERLTAALRIRCAECGDGWNDPGERWRACFTDDEPPEVILFCADCAAFEFC